MAEQQKQTEDRPNVKLLDWMADDYTMEITEGIKFDPEKDYTLELTEIKREAGEKDGKEWQKLNLFWTEQESGVTIRQSHFLNPKVTRNKDDGAKSASLVKLALALGYKAEIGDKSFHPKHFLKEGLKIVARVVDQVNNKTKEKTGFSEIDISTIRPAGKKAQQSLPSIDQTDIAKWQKEVTDSKITAADKYMQTLASTGRFTEIAPFMEATKQNLIKF